MGKSKFSAEVRERAVRMVFEHSSAHESQWAAMRSIAKKIGCTTETLRKWVRLAAGRSLLPLSVEFNGLVPPAGGRPLVVRPTACGACNPLGGPRPAPSADGRRPALLYVHSPP